MTNKRLPLRFGTSMAASPYLASGIFGEQTDQAPAAMRRAVARRDLDSCQFCGFRSSKYQNCIWIDAEPFDLEDAHTVCTFCEQVMRVDLVPRQRSGLLIWLPEVSQADLNRVMPEVYALRLRRGEPATRSRALLDRLMSRREMAKERFGSDDPAKLAEALRSEAAREGDRNSPTQEAISTGLRLLPLDRKIVRASGLEFNQFPQILAFWRSRYGPLPSEKTVASQLFSTFEAELARL